MREVYVLDDDFREYRIIDHYESLIWSERFDEVGDFQLDIEPDENVRQALREGAVVSIDGSYRMMMVETIDTLSEGKLSFKGRSLEAVLESRVGRVGPSGSGKTWLNSLAEQALVVGLYDPEDRILGIENGLNVYYPPSSIAPSTDAAPYSGSGWVGLGDAWGRSKDQSPMGFRIIRKPFTTQLYYETYTGTDRSDLGTIDLDWNKVLWPNPYFFEVDQDIEVWRNIAANPGFTENIRPMSIFSEEHDARNGINPSEVDCDWSMSGKGLLIPSSEERTSNSTTVNMCHEGPNLHHRWIDAALWGKTLTVTAKIEVREVMGGTQSTFARQLIAATSIHGQTESYLQRVTAPNVIGVHSLSITFTLPHKASGGPNRLSIYLANGNGNTDEGVIWGDFCVFEHSSNPVGYFDGDYSPDIDLTPAFMPWYAENGHVLHYSTLIGRRIQGFPEDVALQGVFIQSRMWGKHGSISGRFLRNTTLGASDRYSFQLPKMARYIEVSTYLDEPLPSTPTAFRRLELHRNGTSDYTGPNGPNTSGEHKLFRQSLSGFNSVTLRTGVSFGRSMWFDMLFISEDLYYSQLQREIPPVIFSENLESFVVDRSIASIDDYRNVVYVTRGSTILKMDDGYSGSALRRRVIHVDASQIEAGPNLRREMEELGRRALSEHRRVFLIDGEVPSYSPYIYDVHYSLGDVVMVQDRFGDRMVARVVEQIFTSDKEGSQSRPTLREEDTITFGNWYSSEYNIHWLDAAALGTWADQP